MIVNVKYTVFWEFKNESHYKVTKCKKIINCLKGTIIKQTIRGGSCGYWISNKFIKRTQLNQHLQVIKKEHIPF